MMKKVLLASKNKGKVKELQAILADLSLEILSLDEIDSSIIEPEETGTTFEDNALLKARYYSKKTGLPCLADDSGLEVDALNLRPGVYSARYVEGSDEDRYKKVLEEMQGKNNRTGRFVSVVVFVDPSLTIEKSFRGTVEGTIADKALGTQGFGYDPIFIPNGYTETMGELGPEIKNTISHRANALKLFKRWMEKHE